MDQKNKNATTNTANNHPSFIRRQKMKFCSMNCFIETGIVEDSFANTDFLASKVSKKTFSNEPTSLLENPNGNKFRVYY